MIRDDEADTRTHDEAAVINPLFHAATVQDASNDDIMVPIPNTKVNFEIEAGPEIKAASPQSSSSDSRIPEWVIEYLERIFKIRERGTTVEMEIYTGAIQFISCLYVLPVVPSQMRRCGYPQEPSIVATAVTCCVGCLLGGVLTDMPLIIAPPTSVSIFIAVSLQQQGYSYQQGNAALILSGAALAFIGIVPPVGRFFTMLIPDSIQAAISVGIGMITALAGATEINLIVQGKYTILDMGPLTDEVVIAIACLILVAILMHYHIKGAFCTGLFVGTFLWWCVSKSWPTSILAAPHSQATGGEVSVDVVLLVFNLFVLYILALNGMGRSLSDLAGLTLPSGAIPRGGMLFIVCGLITMLSGYLSGPPILISPESAAGIKAGAKTGLSTVICGLLFGISTFFSPLLAAIPGAGTAPLLIMVGVMMFANVKRIDWVDYKIATSAYCTLFFIPFTYSILRGVAFGYVIYIVIGLFTVDIRENYQYAVEKYSTWMQVTSTYAKFGDAEEPRETTELDAEGTGTEDGPEQQGGSPARKRRSSFAVMHMDMDHLRMDNISRFLDTIALSKSEIERVDFM